VPADVEAEWNIPVRELREGNPTPRYGRRSWTWVLLLRSEVRHVEHRQCSVDRNAVEAQVFFGENHNVLYAVIEKRG
ncbi:hypothetical protein ACFOJ9_38775, partial [Mesorhizobium cantuariense]